MKVCIHQPNYLPYIEFFNKIKNIDVYVLFDVAQYVKRQFHNRTRIRTKEGSMYLTIPLLSKDSYLKRLYDIKLPPKTTWKKEHWLSVERNYVKTDYFDSYKDSLENVYETDFTKLVEFNETKRSLLIKEFKLETIIIKSTDLKSIDLLINILKEVGATCYLSGQSGKRYTYLQYLSIMKIKYLFEKAGLHILDISRSRSQRYPNLFRFLPMKYFGHAIDIKAKKQVRVERECI